MTVLCRKEAAHKERCREMSGGGEEEAKEDKATQGDRGADKEDDEGPWITHPRDLANAMAEFYEGILAGGAVNTSAQDAYLDDVCREARCR